MEHPRRIAILEALRASPRHHRELQRATGMPMGTLTHHVWTLIRAGQAAYTRVGPFVVYHLPDASPRAIRAAVDPDAAEVTQWVGDGTEVQCRILDRAPYPRATTQHRLERAVKHGFLERGTRGRYVTYRVVA